jgi:hypothetical protein
VRDNWEDLGVNGNIYKKNLRKEGVCEWSELKLAQPGIQLWAFVDIK